MSPKTLSALVAASVAAIAAAPAAANDLAEFSYKIYELDTTGGAVDLHARLLTKARQTCTTPGARSLGERAADIQCTEQLADEFVANIDHPRLDRIHNAAG